MIELQKSNAQITFTTPTVSGGGYVDLSDYYTKDEVNNLIQNVEVDLTGYATEDYVKQEIAAIPEVDLTGYATKEQLEQAIAAIPEVDLSGYAKKTDIPDTTGLATEDYVNNAIANLDIPEVDLSNYYTKAEDDGNYNALASAIASNSARIITIENAGYQTAEQVQTAINNALGVIENGTY